MRTGIMIGGWGVIATFLTQGALSAQSVPVDGRLPDPALGIHCWWTLSSAAKVRPQGTPPADTSGAIELRAARNETEAVQLVLRPERPVADLRINTSGLAGPEGSHLGPELIEILKAHYLEVTTATDRHSKSGAWPDPLLPLDGPVSLDPGINHAFWIRLHIPQDAQAGTYRGSARLTGDGIEATVPLALTVYDFTLPDRMSCVTAFGFSPGEVFRYQNLKNDAHKRLVLEKYWANFAAHHVSPYDPAPLDPIRVQWPKVEPPKTVWDDWTGLRIVDNEVHQGHGALLIHDDQDDVAVTAGYEPLIKIPEAGLRLRFWFRTAIPDHRFMVSLNSHDADRKWMSGRNNDITIKGSGRWEEFDQVFTRFPEGAEYLAFHARATRWTDAGELRGLVWIDDISISDPATGAELIQGGDFEVRPRTEPVAPLESLVPSLDFTAWDKAMTHAIDTRHFNSFRLRIPGLGGGTFHALSQPGLLGFGEDTPEYPALLDSYCRQVESHLRHRGWLEEAYVYWFDEPSPDQYAFVKNGFAKLQRSCPDIARMLTEQVEPGLVGGPNLWCPISNNYDHASAEKRRRHGEKFWWYVCTGPKAPYTGLFIDHPAPEMRIWLWQTFKRDIEGILVWQTNYWTSDTAYPEGLQDPYTDPMSWVRGYSTPPGTRRPWGNGDGRFIYPPLAAAAGAETPILDGPVDSIRWEHLRDGIEDYEYLCILRRLLAARRDEIDSGKHRELSRLLEVPENITRSLTAFTSDGAPIEKRRHEIARAIETLQ